VKLKIILLGIITLVILGLVFFLNRPQSSLTNPLSNQETKSESIRPSEALIEYSDPTGFSFSYPDNLSLEKNEVEDLAVYADLELFAKGVNGSLSLKITDSKLKSIEEWAKLNSGTSKEAKLGDLSAIEVKTADRLLLGALDQGILFTLEMPLLEEEFWTIVYEKVKESFSFASPSQEGVSASPEDVTFEGEEVVE